MLLERTIAKPDVDQPTEELAQAIVRAGTLPWRGALLGNASYRAEAV